MRRVSLLLTVLVVGCGVENTEQVGVSPLAIQQGECALDFADCRANEEVKECHTAFQACVQETTGSDAAVTPPEDRSGLGDQAGDPSGEPAGDQAGDPSGEPAGDQAGDQTSIRTHDGEELGASCRAEYESCRETGGSTEECEALQFECVFAVCYLDYDGCRRGGDESLQCTGALGQCMMDGQGDA